MVISTEDTEGVMVEKGTRSTEVWMEGFLGLNTPADRVVRHR